MMLKLWLLLVLWPDSTVIAGAYTDPLDCEEQREIAIVEDDVTEAPLRCVEFNYNPAYVNLGQGEPA